MEKKLSDIDQVYKKKGQPLSLSELATLCRCCTKTMSKRLKEDFQDPGLKHIFYNYNSDRRMIPANVVNYYCFGWLKLEENGNKWK